MKPLLRNPSLQQQFERDGFVTIRLLSPDQIQDLLALYRRTMPQQSVTGLYESSRNNPYELNRLINDVIRQQVSEAAKGIFLPSRIYGGTFMVKSHVNSEMLPLHQDWSLVEEQQYSTLFVWCPLVDVSVLNGGIFALPGSHRWFKVLRSGTYPSNRYVLPEQLHGYVKDIPLQAGEAILYDDALFHGTHANNGDADRIVITAQVIEDKAPLVYFHKSSETQVEVYEGSPEFYLKHINTLAQGGIPPDTPMVYRRAYTHVAITNETLEAEIRAHSTAPQDRKALKLFRDPEKQSAFQRDGFVVLDLIGPEEVKELLAFYASLENAPAPPGGFQVSLDDPRPEFVHKVSDKLITTVRAGIDQHFQDPQIFTASFVTKAKQPRGFVPPHQDWTFVDESRFCSATVWCPLVDVNVDNGALCLLRASHRLYDHVRPSPSPQYAPPFADQLFTIFPYMNVIELRAGQAVVFNNQTLHASPPNTHPQTRVAFGIGVTHRDARLRHYYLLPGNADLMEGYEVSQDFFFSYNNARLAGLHARGERPQGLNSIGVFAMRSRRYETSELEEKISSAGNTKDDTLLERVIGLEAEYTVSAAVTSRAVVDESRPWWRVYSPRNVYREIQYRLKSIASREKNPDSETPAKL